jgi:hypothetical protein
LSPAIKGLARNGDRLRPEGTPLTRIAPARCAEAADYPAHFPMFLVEFAEHPLSMDMPGIMQSAIDNFDKLQTIGPKSQKTTNKVRDLQVRTTD